MIGNHYGIAYHPSLSSYGLDFVEMNLAAAMKAEALKCGHIKRHPQGLPTQQIAGRKASASRAIVLTEKGNRKTQMVLKSLRKAGPCGAPKIAEDLGISAQTATVHLKRLMEDGRAAFIIENPAVGRIWSAVKLPTGT
jgi:hypothetical protein